MGAWYLCTPLTLIYFDSHITITTKLRKHTYTSRTESHMAPVSEAPLRKTKIDQTSGVVALTLDILPGDSSCCSWCFRALGQSLDSDRHPCFPGRKIKYKFHTEVEPPKSSKHILRAERRLEIHNAKSWRRGKKKKKWGTVVNHFACMG